MENTIIIGGGDGVARTDADDTFFVKKSGVKQYLEEIYNHSNSSEIYTMEFDNSLSDGLLELEIEPNQIHPQSRGQIQKVIKSFIFNMYYIFSFLYCRRNTTTIIFLPGFFGYIYSIPAIIMSDNIVLYYGFDPRKAIKHGTKLLTPLRWIFYVMYDTALVSISDIVLCRDDEIIERNNGSENNKFHRSNPIVDISTDDIYFESVKSIHEPVQILFVGTITKRKGLQYLLESINQLQEEDYEVHLNIVGEGDYRQEIESLSITKNIRESVTFYGHVSDTKKLLNFYRDSDIFVLPALGEGFPRVLIEAMSQGIPVITTDVGEINERLSSNEAIIIEPGNSRAITLAIIEIISNHELQVKQVESGIRRAKIALQQSAAEQHTHLIKDNFS